MEQKTKGKKNSVKLTENKKSYTRTEKNKKVNTKVDKVIKEEVKEENSHTGIIVISLILALILALFAYSQLKDDNNTSNKENSNKEDVIEKEDVTTEEDTDSEDTSEELIGSEALGYEEVSTVVSVSNDVDTEIDEEVVEEEMYYAITFNSNGGSDVEKQILTSQEATISPEVIQKDGWSFGGWYSDEALTEEFIFGNHLQEDVTVYAKWVKIVKFVLDDGSVVGMKAVSEGEEIPLLTATDLEEGIVSENHEVAWMIAEEDEDGNIQLSEVTTGTVLTADFAEESEVVLNLALLSKFELEFYMSEESEAIYKEVVTEMRTVSFDGVNAKLLEADPTMDLTKFGWYYLDSEGNKWNFNLEQVANQGITKLYLEEGYTVIYTEKVEQEDEDSTVEYVEIKQEVIAKDSKIEEDNILVPEERDGYIFDGWYLVDETVGETDQKLTEDTVIDSDKVYVGKWIEESTIVIDSENQEEVNDEPVNDEENIEEEITVVEETDQTEELNNDVVTITEVVE